MSFITNDLLSLCGKEFTLQFAKLDGDPDAFDDCFKQKNFIGTFDTYHQLYAFLMHRSVRN